MTVRIGLLGSGFVSNFYLLGLEDVPGWEMRVHGRRSRLWRNLHRHRVQSRELRPVRYGVRDGRDVSDADLRAAWEASANPQLAALTADADRPGIVDVPEQWLVLVTCRDEKQQVELMERFRREGLECRALVS